MEKSAQKRAIVTPKTTQKSKLKDSTLSDAQEKQLSEIVTRSGMCVQLYDATQTSLFKSSQCGYCSLLNSAHSGCVDCQYSHYKEATTTSGSELDIHTCLAGVTYASMNIESVGTCLFGMMRTTSLAEKKLEQIASMSNLPLDILKDEYNALPSKNKEVFSEMANITAYAIESVFNSDDIKLQEQTTDYSSSFESYNVSNQYTFIIKDRKICSVNDNLLNLLKQTEDNLIDKSLFDIVESIDDAKLDTLLEKIEEGAMLTEPISGNLYTSDKNAIACSLYFISIGQLGDNIIACYVEPGRQNKTSVKSGYLNNLLQYIIDADNMAIMIADKDGIIEYYNKQFFLEPSKTKAPYVIGKSIRAIPNPFDKNDPLFLRIREQILNRKYDSIDFDTTILGEHHRSNLRIIPFYNSEMEYSGLLFKILYIDKERKLETSLHETENLYIELANLGESFTVVLDSNCKVTFANNYTLNLLGLENDGTALGSKISPFLYQEDLPIIRECIKRALNNEKNITCECRIFSKDHKIIWVQLAVSPRLNSENEVKGALLQGVVITDRKEYEMKLMESEQRFRQLVNSGETMVLEVNTETQCTFVNDVFCNKIGRTASSIIGTKVHNFSDINHERFEERIQKVLMTGISESYTEHSDFSNGYSGWFKCNISPLFNDEKKIKGALIQLVDITSQYQMEQALSESELQFKELANIGDVLIYQLNENGIINFINKPAEKFYSTDIIGKHYSDVFDKEEIEHWNSLYQKHEVQVFDHLKILSNGDIVWQQTHYSPHYNNENRMVGAISQSIDITQSKLDAIKLSESERQYRDLANLGEIYILQYDQNLCYSFANQRALDFWVLKEEEVLGKRREELFSQIIPETLRYAVEHKESCVFENEFHIRNNRYVFRSYCTPIYTEQGMFKGMLEQCIDITEQRKVEEQLKESENRYRFLANSGETYIATFGIDKRCTYVNKQICDFLGCNEDKILGQYVDVIMPVDAEQVPEFGDLFVHPESKTFTVEITRYDGVNHWIRCMCSPLYEHNQFTGLLVHALDIHQQIESEKKIKASEERYRLLANSGDAMVLAFDSNQCCTFVNKIFQDFAGYPESVCIGKELSSFIYPEIESNKDVISQLNAIFTWPRKVEFELKVKRFDNALVWVRCMGTPLYDNGKFTGVLLQGYDIDKRKSIEVELAKSEKQYRDLANSGDTFVWLADKNNIIIYANQQLSNFSNVPIELIIGSMTPMRFIQSDRDRISMELKKMVDNKKRITIEFRAFRADESERWIRSTITPKFNAENEYIGYIGHAYDITNQKRAELELVSSEQKYRNLANSGETMIIQINDEYKITFINQRSLDFFGLKEERVRNNWTLIDIHPEDQSMFKSLVRQSVNEKSHQLFDIRMQSKDGDYHWIRISLTPQINDDGTLAFLLIQGTDFTDRKLAEIALAQSEQNYRELANSGDTYVIIINREFMITYINRQVTEFFQRKNNDIVGSSLRKILEQDIIEEDSANVERIKLFRDFVTENRIKRGDGDYRWIRSAFSVRYDAHQEAIGYIIHSLDVTDSKEAELAVAESERSYRELANSGETLVMIFNEDLTCTYINKQIEDYTGIDSSELIGHKECFPIDAEHKASFFKQLEEGYRTHNSFIFECQLQHADGGYRWVRINATPRYNANNNFIGFITHTIDIHERRVAELQIEQQKDYFYNLINAGEAFILEGNLNGELVYINDPMLNYIGITYEEAIESKDLHQYFKDENVLFTSSIIEAIKQGETVVHEDLVRYGKTGEYRWVRFVNSPYYNSKGEVVSWMIQGIDIDTVKKSEESLRISEQRVRESEEYYRKLSNAGDTLVWQCDANNVCTYVNQPWIDFTGKDVDDIVRDGFHSVLHPDDQQEEIEHFSRDFPTHKQIFSVKRFYHVVCGHYHWIRSLATPLFNEQGEFIGYIGHCTDISDMVDSEINLQNSEKRFREIFESLQDVFFAMDTEGNILELSPSIKTLLGIDITPDKLIGNNVSKYADFLDVEAIRLAINQTIISNNLEDNEITIHIQGHENIICSFWSQCYRNSLGEPERIVGTLRNITVRKAEEKDLLEQKLLYSSVMQYLSADAYRKDLEGRYVFMNQRMCQRIGLPEKEIIGFTAAEVSAKQLKASKLGKLNEEVTILREDNYGEDHENIIKLGITIDKETSYYHQDNSIRYFHSIKIPVYNALGLIIGTQGFEQDITDEKLNLLALTKTNEDLEQAIIKANAATALYDLAPSGYLILDANRVIKEVNIAASQFTGKAANDMIGHSFSDFITQSSHTEFMNFLHRMLVLPNHQITCELHCIREDGVIYAKAQGVYSIQSSEYLITLVDISDLRATEQHLRQEKQLLAKAEQLSKMGSWRSDLITGELIYSDEFAQLLGFEIETMRDISQKTSTFDSTIMRAIDEESRPVYKQYLRQIRRNELPCNCEIKYHLPNGDERWFYSQCQGQYDENQNCINSIGFLLDITQRKESELVVRESEQRYRDILNFSPDGIIMVNKQGIIVDISPVASNILHYSIDNGHHVNIFDLLDEKEGALMNEMMDRCWNSDTVESGEFMFVHDDGTVICEITAKSVQLSNIKNKKILLNIRNITDRKIMTQKLIRSERLVSLGEMATAMAHEINQPLLSISLSLDNLMDRINHVAPDQSDYIKKKGERIFSDISRIGRLIDHVRAFSREKSHDDDVISSSFDIHESIDNAMIIISEQLKQHGVSVKTEYEPVELIFGNTYRFEQVILNLLTNAKDALASKQKIAGDDFHKQIIIKTYCDDKNDYVEVTDNGTGIKPEIINEVLQPFFTTKESHGVGVGLAISYGIIKNLDGNIDILSDGESYTTFKLTLPIPQSKKQQNK